MPRTRSKPTKMVGLVVLVLVLLWVLILSPSRSSAAVRLTKSTSTCSTTPLVGGVKFRCLMVKPQGFTVFGFGLGTATASWKLSCKGSKPVSDSGQNLGKVFTIKVNTGDTPRWGDLMISSARCALVVTVTSRSVRVYVHVYDRFGGHNWWSAKTI